MVAAHSAQKQMPFKSSTEDPGFPALSWPGEMHYLLTEHNTVFAAALYLAL